MRRTEAINSMYDELAKAEAKFPEWPRDPIHAAAIVSEEAGELTQAALQTAYEDGDPEKMKKEAIQTAAMALRFLIHYEYYAPAKSLQVRGK